MDLSLYIYPLFSTESSKGDSPSDTLLSTKFKDSFWLQIQMF